MKLIVVFFIFSFSLQAQQFMELVTNDKLVKKITKSKNTEKIEYDLNRDGLFDRIESYKNGKITSIEIDSKFSGKIDQWIYFFEYKNSKNPIEISKYDTNNSGHVDRVVKVYKDLEHKYLITVTEVDSKLDGHYDKKFTTITNLNQSEEYLFCKDPKVLNELFLHKLSEQVSDINNFMLGEFFKTDYGYDIHKSCFEKWGGKQFQTLLKNAMSTGLKCLDRLAKENKAKNLSPNGAYNNLLNLELLMSKKNITITCNEKNYDWSSTVAHASADPSDLIQESGIKHPFLSINPHDPKNKKNISEDEKNEFMRTLFHEQLHNLGYRHIDNIEYSYTCETCCLSENEPNKKAEVEAACKICAGTYKGINDKSYLVDLMNWGKAAYKGDRVAKSILNYEKEFPHDRFGLLLYSDASSGVFSPVGVQLAKIFKLKFSNFTEDEKVRLNHIAEYENYDGFKHPKVEAVSIILAKAHVDAYFDNDSKSMLDEIIKNKSTLKEMLKLYNSAVGNDKYLYGGLKERLNDLLVDAWLHSHPSDSPESLVSLKLLKEFKML